MSEKDNTPEKARPDAVSFSAEDALDRILKKSAELDVLRKRQSLLACLGIVLILAILILFLNNLVSFGRSFDTRGLAEKTVNVAMNDLSNDQELSGMKEDFRTVFVPALKSEFDAQIKNGMPKLQESVEAERELFTAHLQNATKERILSHLRKSFSDVEARLLAKHGSAAPSSADLEKALKTTEDKLLSEMEEQLTNSLEDAVESLRNVNNSCMAFKELDDYKSHTELSQKEIETRMLESFLELWIYRINPERGALPAAQKGGI